MAGTPGQGSQTFASTLTDMMTSLAVIFVLLLVIFLKQAHDQSKRAKDDVREQLEAFLKEKSLALKQDAEDPLKLTVAVGENQLQFPVAGSSLSSQGASFVDSFFRNFASKICAAEMQNKVDSIVIEGHTDTSGERTPEGVRSNIALSQRRSYSVLEQALKSVQGDSPTYECLLKLTSANGRGSRSPLFTNNAYNPDLSRRVEIKIRVRSAEQQFKAMAESALKTAAQAAPLVPSAQANSPTK
jgi:flagellar motor protein MotB